MEDRINGNRPGLSQPPNLEAWLNLSRSSAGRTARLICPGALCLVAFTAQQDMMTCRAGSGKHRNRSCASCSNWEPTENTDVDRARHRAPPIRC
jgi:hypothetical protein